MSTFSSISNSGSFSLAYLDASNVIDNTIYVTYDTIDSTLINDLQGIAVTGYRDKTIQDRAIFYLFGGRDSTGVMSATLFKVIIDLIGGGPKLVSESTVSATNTPIGRMYPIMKTVGSFIYVYGGIDELGNILSDLWRFSLIEGSQTEIIPSGSASSPRFLS